VSEEIKLDETEEVSEVVVLEEEQAETIVADRVEMSQSGAGRISAETIDVEQSAIMVVTGAGNVEMFQSGVLVSQGQSVSVTQGGVGAVFADVAELDDTFVGFLAANEVGGDATILIDVKAAVVLGVVVGLVAGLVKALFGRR